MAVVSEAESTKPRNEEDKSLSFRRRGNAIANLITHEGLPEYQNNLVD